MTLEDLNEVSSESEVHITDIDGSTVENIEDENEDNNLENLPEVSIILEQLRLKILEIIFLSALIWSNYTFPNHVCWTFNNMINAVPAFRIFEKKGTDHLPRVFISDAFALPKQRNSGEIFVNMQRIIRSYGSISGIVLELKRIINNPKWNTAWISLFAEAFRWYIKKKSFGRVRTHNFYIVFFFFFSLFFFLFFIKYCVRERAFRKIQF